MKHVLVLLIYLLGLFTLSACDPSYIESKQRRVEFAKKNQGDIIVGVAWSFEDDDFVKGAQLAVEEINNSAEGLFKDRKIKLWQKSDIYERSKDGDLALEIQKERNLITRVSRAFVADPQLIAVIGHRRSMAAIPASINYQYHGVVFLAPTATNIMLTNHSFNYVFRLMPSNEQIGKQLVDYCVKADYKKMAVLYSRGTYEEELTDAFIGSTVAFGKKEQTTLVEIAFSRSFFAAKEEFSDLLADLRDVIGKLEKNKQTPIDAIFIATSAKTGGRLIKQARDMDIQLPIVGADSLYSKTLWEESEGKAQGTVVPALLDDKREKEFFEKYKTLYPDTEEEPDPRAVLGYDAIKLLEYAIKKASTTVPITLATTLHYSPPFQGATGGYRFDPNGNLVNKQLYFKMLCNEEEFNLVEYDASGKPTMGNCEGSIQIGKSQDKDKDSIMDEEDVCPDNTLEEVSEGVYQEGTRKGCPVDNDEDGIMDYLDECQATSQLENLKGVDEKGCPVDLDKDGKLDYEDECLETPKGIEVNNQGCAVIEELEPHIFSSSTKQFFDGNTLSAEGKKALDKVYKEVFLKLLEEYNLNKIEIVGYTDNRGSDEYNQKVSEARAKYVADYFIEKGIDAAKINAIGKGEADPIDTNETNKGRANNRRIEIKMFVFKKITKEDKEELESVEETEKSTTIETVP